MATVSRYSSRTGPERARWCHLKALAVLFWLGLAIRSHVVGQFVFDILEAAFIEE